MKYKCLTNSSRQTGKPVTAFAKSAKPAPSLPAADEGVRPKNIMDKSEIPNDPLSMPPPYWQDSETIDQLIRALQMFGPTLNALSDEIQRINPLLDQCYKESELAADAYDPDTKLFNEIFAGYIHLVYSLGSYADLATLMAAITTESLLNKFCVYNLHHEIVGPLEKLNPPEKLVVSSAILGFTKTKSLAAYEASKRLYNWRNSYAHGHCVMSKGKGLVKNHLRESPVGALEREAPQIIVSTIDMISFFLRIVDFLGEITRNEYVLADEKNDIQLIRELLFQISAYHFTNNAYPYEIQRPNNEE